MRMSFQWRGMARKIKVFNQGEPTNIVFNDCHTGGERKHLFNNVKSKLLRTSPDSQL